MAHWHRPLRAGKWRASLASVVLAATLFGPAAAGAQNATFYEHLDYSGASFGSSTDLSFVGWEWNDLITSVAVPSGGSVTLYEHDNFGGMSITLTSDASDLRVFAGPGVDGTWNDAASSIRVAFTSSPPPRAVVLVNGSFNAYPPWMDQGASEFQAIAATYGTQPMPFRWTDNDFSGVSWPYYSGIANGAAALGSFISAIQSNEVYVVTHSHGGNVALGATQFFTNRPVNRLINLATPVNYDIRYSNTPWVGHMCTASSWDDWVQFWGASPGQVYNFMSQSYYGYVYGQESAEAWLQGNTADAMYYAALAYQYIAAGYSWFESTKLELWGWTVPFDDGGHGDMHEPPVWNRLPSQCKF